jgi:hypothetical protein
MRDFLPLNVDQWEVDRDVRAPLGSFVSKLSKGEKVHVMDSVHHGRTFIGHTSIRGCY